MTQLGSDKEHTDNTLVTYHIQLQLVFLNLLGHKLLSLRLNAYFSPSFLVSLHY